VTGGVVGEGFAVVVGVRVEVEVEVVVVSSLWQPIRKLRFRHLPSSCKQTNLFLIYGLDPDGSSRVLSGTAPMRKFDQLFR
jgi:hypothetical protein